MSCFPLAKYLMFLVATSLHKENGKELEDFCLSWVLLQGCGGVCVMSKGKFFLNVLNDEASMNSDATRFENNVLGCGVAAAGSNSDPKCTGAVSKNFNDTTGRLEPNKLSNSLPTIRPMEDLVKLLSNEEAWPLFHFPHLLFFSFSAFLVKYCFSTISVV